MVKSGLFRDFEEITSEISERQRMADSDTQTAVERAREGQDEIENEEQRIEAKDKRPTWEGDREKGERNEVDSWAQQTRSRLPRVDWTASAPFRFRTGLKILVASHWPVRPVCTQNVS